MLRVKDAKASLNYYQNILGMTLIRTHENKEAKFTNYFLAYPPAYPIPASSEPHWTAHREGILELTHNHGTEDDASFSYHDGNKEPQGFGHICISVDDIHASCAYFEEKKVNFKKRLTDGRMRHIAFILDPDGYWIEVIQNHVHGEDPK
jgi:lactoylglutathione lyase